jgi:DNA-binding NarL/FixJ family response regulator
VRASGHGSQLAGRLVPPRPRAVICDAAAPVRVGVRLALERDDFVVVAEATTAGGTVEEVVRLRPDVCLMDILLPCDGIGAVRAIRGRAPETAVIILTTSSERDHVIAALRAGAAGYLLKTTDLTRLSLAVRGALAGEAAIPRVLVTHVIEELRGSEGQRASTLVHGGERGLTPRECQVLILLTRELPTREIASQLGVADVTVRRHVSEICRKLQVPDRTAAVREVERWAAEARRPAAGVAGVDAP